MNNWPTQLLEFWTATANHLWQSTIVLAFLGLLAMTLRKAPGRIRNGLWTIGLAKFVIPFSVITWAYHQLGLVLPIWQPGLDTASGSTTVSAVYGIWSPVILSSPAETVIGTGTATLLALLTTAWGTTTLWLMSRSIAAWISNRPRRSIEPSELDTAIRERLETALESTGIDVRRIQLSRDTRAPGVTGFYRPVIILSEDLLISLPLDALQAVLLHEEAHRRRYEPLRYGIQRVLLSLFFYFPPLWLLLRQLHDTAEQSCDEAALDKGTHPGAYLTTLRKVVALDLAPAATLAAMAGARPSSFARRLSRIRTYERRSVMLRHRLALLAGLAIFFASGLVAGNAVIDPARSEIGGSARNTQLEQLESIDLPIIINFQEVELETILNALSAAAGFQVELVGEGPENVTANFGRTTVREMLTRLGTELGLSYTVEGPNRLTVQAPGHPGMDNIEPPRRLEGTFIQPVYPETARRDQVTGMAILQVIILDDGSIGHPSVLKEDPEGYEFGRAALDAVWQWRYEPATQDGEPVSVWLTIAVQFNLDAEKPPTEEPPVS